MRFYHRTDPRAAVSIIEGGFRDGAGSYMTDRLWSGVWISDVPLDENDGANGAVLLAIDVADTVGSAWLGSYEWVCEESEGFRELLVPAELVNRDAAVKIDELDDWPERMAADPDPTGYRAALVRLAKIAGLDETEVLASSLAWQV